MNNRLTFETGEYKADYGMLIFHAEGEDEITTHTTIFYDGKSHHVADMDVSRLNEYINHLNAWKRELENYRDATTISNDIINEIGL